MASSSFPKCKKNYDIFLSFRGTDVRNKFLSHLYAALKQHGLFTYIDSEELRKGEKISPALMKAIEESRVAIIVFSKDYASSSWCLEEVAKIMECKVQKDLIVLPVFYEVEPREVKEGRQSYGRAIAKHESRFGKNSDKVKRWKKALFEAGNLSGWHLNNGVEAKFIKKIAKEISRQLDRRSLHVAKHPVGIDPRVVELKSMLNLESNDDVLMIGLWGPGGIGKTTLGKALYNAIFRQFEGSCFLENVREAVYPKDLVHLQEKLLSEILPGQRLVVSSVSRGINLIHHRLCHKKVLLVLDDVNNLKQLESLAEKCEWFGEGSRIIITTRDKHLLTYSGIDEDHIYQVKPLDYCEAHELLNGHALPRNNKIIRSDLVDRALHYANGLPLALKVLGFLLCGRRECEQESALDKCVESPDKNINDVLKLSYDELEDYVKEIFLDIACFFKGQSREYITQVLDSCDFRTTIGVQVLVEKSMIIEEKETLQMHNLFQLMAMDIVKQQCSYDPRRRSRLWLLDDVLNVLSQKMVPNAVEAIALDLPKPEVIYIGVNGFKDMIRLRMLKMINVRNSFQGVIGLPNGLKWFEWPCPPWIPEIISGPKQIAGLDMPRSNIVVREQLTDFKNINIIDFRGYQPVFCMSDLSSFPNLEKLYLSSCTNLERVDESIAYHDKLQSLQLSRCPELQMFPDIPNKIKGLQKTRNLDSLKHLDLSMCAELEILPSSICRLRNLKTLNFSGCSKLIKFPKMEKDSSDPHSEMVFPELEGLFLRGCNLLEAEFLHDHSCFPSLFTLDLSMCAELEILPSSIYRLRNLKTLNLSGCSKLIKFPKMEKDSSDSHSEMGFPELECLLLGGCNLLEAEFLHDHSCFPSLIILDLSRNNFTVLPTCKHLYNLRILGLLCCKQLQEILQIPRELRFLSADGCISLRKLPSDTFHVKNIDLSSCPELVGNGFSLNDWLKTKKFRCETNCKIILPEGKMPNWLLPNKEGYIDFVASKDLCKKILGVAFWVVFQVEKECYTDLVLTTSVDGKKSEVTHCLYFGSYNLENVCFEYVDSKWLWTEDNFGPNDSRHFHIRIGVDTCTNDQNGKVIMKECGFRLICDPLEIDVEVSLQDDQLLDPALFYVVSQEDNPTST